MNVKTWIIVRTYIAYLALMEAVAWQKGAHTWPVFALVAAAALVGPALTALDPWDKSYGLVWETVVVKLLRIAGMSSLRPLLLTLPAAPVPVTAGVGGGIAQGGGTPILPVFAASPAPVPAPPVDVPQVPAPQAAAPPPPAQL